MYRCFHVNVHIYTGNATYTDWCICDGMCELYVLRITVFDYNVWYNHAELWSKSRPDFDTPVSKFGRSLVEVWSKFGVAVWYVIILSKLLCISLIYRANFDQTSTLGVSKFGRSLVEVWSKFRHWGGRGLVEISAKLRHPSAEYMHI